MALRHIRISKTAFALVLSSLGAFSCTNSGPLMAPTQYASTSNVYSPATNYGNTGTGTSTTPYTGVDFPTASPTPSPTPSTGVAPLSMRVGTIGYTSVTQTVSTRTVLKIAFTPGQQDQTVAGTNFEPTYSHMGVYITVGKLTEATEMLSNGLLDGVPAQSRVIDFSAALPSTCKAGDTTCIQTVSIIVSKPNNDYFCMNFQEYCPWAGVYNTHPWNGTIFVQTDDTDAI